MFSSTVLEVCYIPAALIFTLYFTAGKKHQFFHENNKNFQDKIFSIKTFSKYMSKKCSNYMYSICIAVREVINVSL